MIVRPILACALLIVFSGTSAAQSILCDRPVPQSMASGQSDDEESDEDENYVWPGYCGPGQSQFRVMTRTDVEMDTGETILVLPEALY